MKKLFVFLIIIVNCIISYSQNYLTYYKNLNFKSNYLNSAFENDFNTNNLKLTLKNSKSEITPQFIGLIIICALNPIVLYENKKVYFGTTRELTVGFGKYTRFRISVEYSYLLRDFLKHHFRISAKYDFQLSKSKGEYFPDQLIFSAGAGYFLDEGGSGIFPELSVGYKIGEGLLVIPYVKLRYTYMFKNEKSNNADFSFGAILGYRLF